MKIMKAILLICLLSSGCAFGAIFSAADIHKGDRQAVKVESNIDKVETTGIKTDKIETDISASLLNTTKNDSSVNVNNPWPLFWTNVINGAFNLVPFVLTILLMIRFMKVTMNKMLDVINEIVNNISDSLDKIVEFQKLKVEEKNKEGL